MQPLLPSIFLFSIGRITLDGLEIMIKRSISVLSLIADAISLTFRLLTFQELCTNSLSIKGSVPVLTGTGGMIKR